jgi:hypothetical protein
MARKIRKIILFDIAYSLLQGSSTCGPLIGLQRPARISSLGPYELFFQLSKSNSEA